MRSQEWGFHRLEYRPKLYLKADPPLLPLFVPQGAVVEHGTIQYPTDSLLGLPLEIRYQIWDYVLDDVESMRAAEWVSKPRTPYDALPLASRQIYHEMRDYLSSSIIPKNRLTLFFNQPYSQSKLLGFESLTLEIPFNMDSAFFTMMARALQKISPVLQHFQLFFTGKDAYGTRVYLHGCGNKIANAASRDHKLPQDGQGFGERHVLVNTLSLLTNLKTLTLSNLNMPILQQHFLRNKPELERLCIVTDPRTTLHLPWKIKNSGQGLLLPVTENFPPVRELYLSANAVVGCIQVPGKLSQTLQKVTWVVPNLARQAGSMIRDWHEETGILLMNLRSNARELHTLRICIEGSTYEGHETYGHLIGAFKEHMPRIRNLKHFELHLWSKSPYIGREFIQALPKSLKRFYISDRFMPTEEIFKCVRELYFAESQGERIHAIDLAEPEFPGLRPRVVEELKRKDYIALQDGKLGFITNEYDDCLGRWRMIEANPYTLDASREHQLDDTTMSLLWLNARLLDRERQSHLAKLSSMGFLEPGVCIPPRIYPAHAGFTGSAARTKNDLMALVANASIPEHGYCFEYEADVPDLDDTHMCFIMSTLELPVSMASFVDRHARGKAEYHFKHADFDRHFGQEAEAEKVFQAERVMKAQDLLPLKYPVVVPCPTGYEDHEHWMCD